MICCQHKRYGDVRGYKAKNPFDTVYRKFDISFETFDKIPNPIK